MPQEDLDEFDLGMPGMLFRQPGERQPPDRFAEHQRLPDTLSGRHAPDGRKANLLGFRGRVAHGMQGSTCRRGRASGERWRGHPGNHGPTNRCRPNGDRSNEGD